MSRREKNKWGTPRTQNTGNGGGPRGERRVEGTWKFQTLGPRRACSTREEEVGAELGPVWGEVPSLVPSPHVHLEMSGHRPLVSSLASKTSWGRLKVVGSCALRKQFRLYSPCLLSGRWEDFRDRKH